MLLDYYAYTKAHGIDYFPYKRHEITIADLEKVAAWEGVSFQPGDILIIRTGWTEWHDSIADDDEKKIELTRDKHDSAGLFAGEETAEWIWYVTYAYNSAIGTSNTRYKE